MTVPTPVLRKSSLSLRGIFGLLYQSLRTLPSMVRLLQREGADALYISTITQPLWLVAGVFARVPSIVHVHEAQSEAPYVLRCALAAPLVLSKSILANSQFSATTLFRVNPFVRRRTTVLYNGVRGPDAASAPRPQVGGRVRVCYVGRLSPRKGVHVLVDAARILSELDALDRLEIVGAPFTGYEWYVDELRQSIKAGGLERLVFLTGFASSVWDVLANADIAVVPSVAPEPFGNTAVEAVLACRAVVVTSGGGLPEAVDGVETARVVEPSSAHALVDAIIALRGSWQSVTARVGVESERTSLKYSIGAYQSGVADAIFRLFSSSNDEASV